MYKECAYQNLGNYYQLFWFWISKQSLCNKLRRKTLLFNESECYRIVELRMWNSRHFLFILPKCNLQITTFCYVVHRHLVACRGVLAWIQQVQLHPWFLTKRIVEYVCMICTYMSQWGEEVKNCTHNLKIVTMHLVC